MFALRVCRVSNPLLADEQTVEEFFTYQFIVWVWPIIGAVGLGTFAYFARRYVRAHEKMHGPQSEIVELRQRIESLEEAIEASQADVARLATAQDFTARLLTDRLPTAP